jgi:hypothetical protein
LIVAVNVGCITWSSEMARARKTPVGPVATVAPVALPAQQGRPSLSELVALGSKQASLDVWKDRAFTFCKEFADDSHPPSVDDCKKGGIYYYAFQAWEKLHFPKADAPAFPS